MSQEKSNGPSPYIITNEVAYMTIILWIVVAVLKFMLSIIIDYNYNITYRIQNIYRFFEGFEEEKFYWVVG